ncbi:phosphatase PAP2 family protein [Streptomyces winkii]|uniref:phosphatase PAP2 family protein n=1 Tax=Streptomyces winkii TaxID=3051178 RepID=UPI0028D0CB14|nr:phosphatase PAP2 family protein [Streptomyces sp. DSM 40971]
MAVWDDPDVDLLYEINGLAEAAPAWADRTIGYVGEFGVVAVLVLLGVIAWWRVVRRKAARDEAVAGFAGLIWAPLAAGIALLVNIPIRDLVERPRPFVEHRGLDVLVHGKGDYSFVSDHSTLAMALAVGIFMVDRRYGLLSIVLAVPAGFSRVYLGVHYPTDVIGGLALGAAVALLLAPVAMWGLTPLVRRLANSPRTGSVVWAGPAESEAEAGAGASTPSEETEPEPETVQERETEPKAASEAEAPRNDRDLAA